MNALLKAKNEIPLTYCRFRFCLFLMHPPPRENGGHFDSTYTHVYTIHIYTYIYGCIQTCAHMYIYLIHIAASFIVYKCQGVVRVCVHAYLSICTHIIFIYTSKKKDLCIDLFFSKHHLFFFLSS